MGMITDLVNKSSGKVYMYLANDEVGNGFLKQTECEGFTFGDGAKPTDRCYEEIMAVEKDHTIHFVGSIGRMAFGSGATTVGKQGILRVDFAKYLNGDTDYLYHRG